jgi:hypothetical protein
MFIVVPPNAGWSGRRSARRSFRKSRSGSTAERPLSGIDECPETPRASTSMRRHPLGAGDEPAAGRLSADQVPREVGPPVCRERAVGAALLADEDEKSHFARSVAGQLLERDRLRGEARFGVTRAAPHEDVPLPPRRKERRNGVRVRRQDDARMSPVDEEVAPVGGHLHGLDRPARPGVAALEELEERLLRSGHRGDRDEVAEELDRPRARVRRDVRRGSGHGKEPPKRTRRIIDSGP